MGIIETLHTAFNGDRSKLHMALKGQPEINRRSALEAAGIMLAAALTASCEPRTYNQLENDFDLQIEIAKVNAEIEKQGISEAVQSHVEARDLANSIGEKLWNEAVTTRDSNKRQEIMNRYYRLFVNERTLYLRTGGPDYNHHTPAYWQDMIEIVRFKPEALEYLERLNLSLVQHASNFGHLGDENARVQRIKEMLEYEHSIRTKDPQKDKTASLILELEEAKLRRDIGVALLGLQSSLDSVQLEQFNDKTKIAIARWVSKNASGNDRVLDVFLDENPFN